jgi:hypothetical protein
MNHEGRIIISGRAEKIKVNSTEVGMVTAERNTAFPKVVPWRQRASDSAEQVFIAKARALGVEVSPLLVRKPARVFPWIGRNEKFFHEAIPKSGCSEA